MKPGYHAMPPGSHERLFVREDDHWWCRAVRMIAKDALRRHKVGPQSLIIDVGCGSGAMLREMTEYENIFGIEISPEALRLAALVTRKPLARANARSLPFEAGCADAILALDVLCNMEGDFEVETLKEARRVLKPGGKLFMNLPAHRFMAGAHDLRMGVRRRYETREVRKYLTDAGFNILEIFHWNLFLMPVAFIIRKITFLGAGEAYSDLSLTPPFLDGALFALMRFDVGFCRLIKSPVGISLFCVAERKGG